jgi:hypothetical protein
MLLAEINCKSLVLVKQFPSSESQPITWFHVAKCG